MAKITNPRIFIDENTGKMMVSYTRETSKGEIEEIVQPYYLTTGKVDPEVEQILIKAEKDAILGDLNEKNNSEILAIEDSEYVNMPEVVDTNKNWFERNLGKVALVAGAIGFAIAAFNLKGCGKEVVPVANPIVTEKPSFETPNDDVTPEETPAPEETIEVAGAVKYISYEDAIADMARIGKEWQDLGYNNVSQRSINATYFAVNFEMFEKETVKLLIENNVVADDPMVIIQDTLEVSNVCHDQGTKRVAGQDKPIIDMSMFCVDAEDKILATTAYKTVVEMVDSEDKELVEQKFNDFYYYYCNEEKTDFGILYNESNVGVRSIIMKPLAVIACEKASYEGIPNKTVNYLFDNTGMLDFSSVIKSLQGCMNETTVQPEENIVR